MQSRCFESGKEFVSCNRTNLKCTRACCFKGMRALGLGFQEFRVIGPRGLDSDLPGLADSFGD